MLLWFAGTALVALWVVFRDPALDHRIVVLGSLVPLVEALVVGRAGVLHTLLGAVVLLGLIQGLTHGHRHARRRWLGLAIGVFFHQVFTGAWAITELFWFPVDGGLPDVAAPAFDRPLVVTVVLEALGAVALVWAVTRFGLLDAERRRLFVRTGRLDRSIVEPDEVPPSC